MNYLWIDVETTGLNPSLNDIVQLACIPVIGGVKQKPFNEFCQPTNWGNIDQAAVNVHGITVEMMKTFQTQEQMLENFIKYLETIGGRFLIAGYNVGFDKKFTSALFSKYGVSARFEDLFDHNIHDTYQRVKGLSKAQLPTENKKLETLAGHFGIQIKAHDALSDIDATIEVDKIVSKIIGEDDYEYAASAKLEDIKIASEFRPLPQLSLKSQYSFGHAVPTIEDWATKLKKDGVPGFGITDYGSGVSLYNIVKQKDIVGVPGVCLNVKFKLEDEDYFKLNVWAISNEGYFNVMKLSSLGFDNTISDNGNSTPIITMETILEHRDGLKFGTATTEGLIGRSLYHGDTATAKQAFLELSKIFGDDLYLEFDSVDITRIFDSKLGFRKVRRNTSMPEGNFSKALNVIQFELMQEHKCKAIPTTNACFFEAKDKILQDILMKNNHKDNKSYYESRHLKDSETVYKELKIHIGDAFNEDIYNIMLDSCYDIVNQASTIEIKHDYHMPKIDIPSEIVAKYPDDYDAQTVEFLMYKIKEHGRWIDTEEYKDRFKYELEVIKDNEAMNFIPYFLLYEDLGTYARSKGFLQNIARGSAGGSLISYYLKVIHVDPIAADLPFERFLSHARIRAGSWPDIDMDISKTARPFITKYLKEKYDTGFAQVATLSTMKTKNAIKDAMFALHGMNRNHPEIKQVCDTIPDSPQGVGEDKFLYGFTDKEGNEVIGHLEENPALQMFFKKYPGVARVVTRLIGIVRGWSRHASAFVVSTLDLASSRCATMRMWDNGMNDWIYVTQLDAKMCESVGLVKADILGLKTLTVVSDAVHLIHKNTGINYLDEDNYGVQAIYRLEEDADVYADFFNKATDSSFQFNTNLIKGFIQEFNPTERRHLKDMTALCRPGALDAEWEPGVSAAQYYLDVRNGKRQVQYVHSDLKELLGPTNGVFVYQEQVMKFLVDFGGHTLEDSDAVRGAIAKKKKEIMQEAFDKVRIQTASRGWTSDQTEKVCSQIEAFARYSFNLSHSHAYSELGYITMYLKHHHPLEWWSSVLNSEDDEDKMRHYVSYLGEIIKPPSLKFPSSEFVILRDKIVAPLSVIKSVGDKSVEELVSKGPFNDLDDFLARVNHSKCNIGVMGQLIKARAADDLMDLHLPYDEARSKFMDDYIAKRKTKSLFKPALKELDPMSIFLMERDSNKSFNKTILDDPLLRQLIEQKMPAMKATGNRAVPYMFGNLYVLSNLKIAEALFKKDKKGPFGFLLLYNASSVKKGISKKGNAYHFVNVMLNDGYHDIQATDWNRMNALKWSKDSIIYLEGELKEGWRNPIQLNITNIEQIL